VGWGGGTASVSLDRNNDVGWGECMSNLWGHNGFNECAEAKAEDEDQKSP
jgi:hypothetical protein